MACFMLSRAKCFSDITFSGEFDTKQVRYHMEVEAMCDFLQHHYTTIVCFRIPTDFFVCCLIFQPLLGKIDDLKSDIVVRLRSLLESGYLEAIFF